ncbi:MAG: hypothetical protein OJJ21_03155 [Ferrovibrio sp.]|uniref:hypothetical protein n=1 Tax=Ferrovibrio sp. TaxID=1917215 RepID=UPI002615B1CE|nr:hypothetical protein [Ferrovibrio sp.]MCW0232576.1 hypothetical protein [Ferrovibrio sp.]
MIWPEVFPQYRHAVLISQLLCITGKIQREGLVIHPIADKIDDLTAMPLKLSDIADQGGFDSGLARADKAQKSVRKIGISTSLERVLLNGYNIKELLVRRRVKPSVAIDRPQHLSPIRVRPKNGWRWGSPSTISMQEFRQKY